MLILLEQIMIEITLGNILDFKAEVLVNTVNTKGVMGKGIALAFKKRFPMMYKDYRVFCDEGKLEIGKLHVWETGLSAPKYIINLPTKDHWRQPSKIDFIDQGLAALTEWLRAHKVSSIVIPPLGAGLGGLDWKIVQPLIEKHMTPLSGDIEVKLITPGHVEPIVEKKNIAEVKLTTMRAMLLELMHRYQDHSEELNAMSGQKLAYLLQRSGLPLRLEFEKGWYGPYAPILNKVWQVLQPQYLQFQGDMNHPFTEIRVNHELRGEVQEALAQQRIDSRALDMVMEWVSGFESTFGLELLASVDYAYVQRGGKADLDEVVDEIHQWTTRKAQIMPRHMIEAAFKRTVAMNEQIEKEVI